MERPIDINCQNPAFTEGNPKPPALLIARGFLHQRYPLSPEGLILREQVRAALTNNRVDMLNDLQEALPTVEYPHLELFQDLRITDDNQKKAIFGFRELVVLQTTKGCSHDCSFCAASAPHKIQTMPFAAITLIAPIKKQYDLQMEDAWSSWKQTVKDATGADITAFRSFNYFFDHEDKLVPGFKRIGGTNTFVNQVLELYNKHPIKDFVDITDILEETDSYSQEKGLLYRLCFKQGASFSLMNYYDSDPFDYRDPTFRHIDGSPADYGDAVKALATETKPIHITTAGWQITDSIAQRAAEKINKLAIEHPEYFDRRDMVRISINKYEHTARRHQDAYLLQMKNVITALQNAHPEIIFIYNTNDPADANFIKKVVDPLEDFITATNKQRTSLTGHEKPHSNFRITFGISTPSYYSGRLEDPARKDLDRDIMSCVNGVIIYPDGIAASIGKIGTSLKEGARPVPLGVNIFPDPTS